MTNLNDLIESANEYAADPTVVSENWINYYADEDAVNAILEELDEEDDLDVEVAVHNYKCIYEQFLKMEMPSLITRETLEPFMDNADFIDYLLDSPTNEWVVVGYNADGELIDYYVGCRTNARDAAEYAYQHAGFYEIYGIRSYAGIADPCNFQNQDVSYSTLGRLLDCARHSNHR